MSKQDELQYEQQEKRIQAQSDAFITLCCLKRWNGTSLSVCCATPHLSPFLWAHPKQQRRYSGRGAGWSGRSYCSL